MRRYTIVTSIALALALYLGGCDRQSVAPLERTGLTTPAMVAVPPRGAASAFPAAERDPKAVLAWWEAALERRDWAAARSAWGDFGQGSGLSAGQFAQAWGQYRTVAVEIGAGEGDAGAGSLFYQAPITLSGILQDGTPYRRSGTVLIRRVNDVDGASAEQLRWHIEKLDLQP